jgi:hypothetical protein
MGTRIDRSGELRLVLLARPRGGLVVGVRAAEPHLPQTFTLPGESQSQFIERLRQTAIGSGTVAARLIYADEMH